PLSVSESKTKDKNGVNYDVLIKMSDFGGWNLVSIIDHDKARSDIITLRNNSIFTAVILASVFFAILLFTMRLMLKPLHQLTDAMVNISSGSADLTVRIPNSTDQEFSKIINSFNIFVGNLQSIVSEVKMNSEKINCITTETQELVEVCNNSVADQYRELDMLASSMNEMVATSNQIAQITSEASEITSKINGQVNEGVGAVSSVTESVGNLVEKLDKTKSVIQDLNRQTQNIDVILKAINDIADQTNLLALNAAIEAARAGENGRGFAVVADEVRSLAIKTQESTKNIGSIIHILQENSLLSVHVMDESFNIASETMTISADSKQCLDNISQSVIQIVDITNQVATAAYEQSHVSEEINSNSISIKDKADTLSSLGNKISQQAYSQKALIGHQDDLISKFII
ncbi:methyl-accepting chemotaxis protein AcfB, partial [Vibrio cholerae]|nr:methyl-accepting chemotaxis protein AcfB [Vibrio cholerae]